MGGMRWTVLLLGLVILAGCGPVRIPDGSGRDYVEVLGGSVVLKQELTVPAGYGRVFLQRGEVVTLRTLDRYFPSCNFEVRDVFETKSQTIRADSFIITRADMGLESLVRSGPVMLASLIMVDSDGGSPMRMYELDMRIQSKRQPDVIKLTCRGALDDISSVDPVSIPDIHTALGKYATFKLP